MSHASVANEINNNAHTVVDSKDEMGHTLSHNILINNDIEEPETETDAKVFH
jgi:hypothetical protein